MFRSFAAHQAKKALETSNNSVDQVQKRKQRKKKGEGKAQVKKVKRRVKLVRANKI